MLLKACFVITLIAFVCSNPLKLTKENSSRKVVRSENKDSVITPDGRCEPGNVPTLWVTSFINVIFVEWTSPETCVSGFIVSLNVNDTQIEVIYDNSIEIYDHLFDELEACTTYEVGVTVIGDDSTLGNLTSSFVTTLVPFGPEPISYLSYIISNTSVLVLNWRPPFLQGNCITEYDLYVWDPNNNVVVNTTLLSTRYELTPFVPCSYYGVRVIPFIGIMGGGQVTELIITPEREAQPPVLVALGIGSTSATLILSLEAFATNPCEVTLLSTQCIVNDIFWFGFTQLYEDSSSRPEAVINIASLSPNTRYNCEVTVANSGGISEPSAPIIFTTISE